MAVQIDEILQALTPRAGQDATRLKRFATKLYRRADSALVRSFGVPTLARIAEHGLDFLTALGSNNLRVQVYNPTEQSDGYTVPYTVLALAITDRPFVIDSVLAELRRRGVAVHHLLHPIVEVERDATGAVHTLEEGAGTLEAFELFFLEHIATEDERGALQAAIEHILGDVILATDAYHDLQAKSSELADYLGSLRGNEHAESIAGEVSIEEYEHFFRWLQDDHFVFLGYREYTITGSGDEQSLARVEGSGVGILERDTSAYGQPVPLTRLDPALRARVVGGKLVTVTKTTAESTVHRDRRMDYLGVKRLDDDGNIIGELRIVGLFTSKALSLPVENFPVLREKLREVLKRDQSIPGSHEYKAMIDAFNSFPRESLFGFGVDELLTEVRTIVDYDPEQGAVLSLLDDPLKRGINVMVLLPRDRYSGTVREAIQAYLSERLNATRADYRLAYDDEHDHARFHFFFLTDKRVADVNVDGLHTAVGEIARTWHDELREQITTTYDADTAQELIARYQGAFDQSYRSTVTVDGAMADIEALEQLGKNDQQYVAKITGTDNETNLVIYHYDAGIALSNVMPILENTGFYVLEQHASVVSPDNTPLGVDAFKVRAANGDEIDPTLDHSTLTSALEKLLAGHGENDRLNRLVMNAGLSLREVQLLRTYQIYYAQINVQTSRGFINNTLLEYPHIAKLLMDFFAARFTPGGSMDERLTAQEAVKADILTALSDVQTLAEDAALRGLLNLMEATVRTNYYRNFDRIAIKIESSHVTSMPEPRPYFEIAVVGSNMMGTHLRGGEVSRGGIRWSDRHDDFRTEVLGLMKTQMTKNAVIVPVGSKGGFVIQNAPTERDELLAFVRAQYQEYIRGMLDLTDNVVNGEQVFPTDTVVYDEFDPYIVAAADKGTAGFSDLANATAKEYNFWLDDAFASGGSAGYDHKGMGITARGGWEGVKRQFGELGTDIYEHEFTVVGIGDMAGDVFGNGMLYTDKIRLVGAFNHIHIFIDPNPGDTKAAYAERKRLFETPRSTWKDYNPELISAGGGVFDRSAVSIPLSPEIREALDIDAEALSGQDLIRAILMAPVDLLWNGGIGTYVKSSKERHSEVGDAANDGVRVDGRDLRAVVVGEGGNLGFTQLGRIEYALNGGRLDTDAIHNSGGVNASDIEVNIKIMFQPLLADNSITRDERNSVLYEMTDEVADLILANNKSQTRAISLAHREASGNPMLYVSLLDYLAENVGLDRAVEYLPSRKQIEDRRVEGKGFTRPELAVMLSYVKMGIYSRLLETDLPDEPFLHHYLTDYFPSLLQNRFADAIDNHQLRREITATEVTNKLVDLLGMSFVHRVMRNNSTSAITVIRAALIALELLDGLDVAKRLLGQKEVGYEDGYDALEQLVSAVEGVTSWLIAKHLVNEDPVHLREMYHEPLALLRDSIGEYLAPAQRAEFDPVLERFTTAGYDDELAALIAGLSFLPGGINIIGIMSEQDTDVASIAPSYYELGEHLHFPWFRRELAELSVSSSWERVAMTNLEVQLRDTQERLVSGFTRSGKATVSEYLADNTEVKQFQASVRTLQVEENFTFASAMVLLQMLERAEHTLA